MAHRTGVPHNWQHFLTDVHSMMRRVKKIDVLINNAGVWQIGIAEEMKLKDARGAPDSVSTRAGGTLDPEIRA